MDVLIFGCAFCDDEFCVLCLSAGRCMHPLSLTCQVQRRSRSTSHSWRSHAGRWCRVSLQTNRNNRDVAAKERVSGECTEWRGSGEREMECVGWLAFGGGKRPIHRTDCADATRVFCWIESHRDALMRHCRLLAKLSWMGLGETGLRSRCSVVLKGQCFVRSLLTVEDWLSPLAGSSGYLSNNSAAEQVRIEKPAPPRSGGRLWRSRQEMWTAS